MTDTLQLFEELMIEGVRYRVAEHPAAHGFPYGQEGRRGVVYQLVAHDGSQHALKVFRPYFREPRMVSVTSQLALFTSLPGLQACQRTVFTASRHTDLLKEHPELAYAVLMPWIEGNTWVEMVREKEPISPDQALRWARSLASELVMLEERSLAHCDLSGPNLILTSPDLVSLVDLEEMYGPGFIQPAKLPAGSEGYAHRTACDGLWFPQADRFAGAVLLSEMLGWCDPRTRHSAWGDSFFSAKENQQDGERFHALHNVLEERWGKQVAKLFTRAWLSDSLLDCPTFAEWCVALPDKAHIWIEPDEKPVPPPIPPGDDIEALVFHARSAAEQGDRARAVALYRQAMQAAPLEMAIAIQAQIKALTSGNGSSAPGHCPRCGNPLDSASETCNHCQKTPASTPVRPEEGTDSAKPGPHNKPRNKPRFAAGILLALMLFCLLGGGGALLLASKLITGSPAATTASGPTGIYFSSNRTGQEEIYLLTGSGELLQITNTPGNGESFLPAPTGKGDMYFNSNRTGKQEIYLLTGNGELMQITNTPGNGESILPAPTLDGSLYFTSDRTGKQEIYLLTGSGELLQITNTPGNGESLMPAPTQDGSLYFTSDRTGKQEIYLLTGSGELLQITNTPDQGESWGVAPAQDGSLYFTSDRTGKQEIYLLTGSGELLQVTNTPGNGESLLPAPTQDGSLYFASNRSGKQEIYLLTGSGELLQITKSPGNAESWWPAPTS